MYFIVSMIFAIVVLTAPKGAEARKWRVTPTDLAGDYTQIIDQRSDKDVVVIYWIAPETMNSEMQNAEVYRAMLRENLIVGVAQGPRVTPGGLNFRFPEGL